MIAAVLQHRKPLALGNILGSTISNTLGAFSLGLLFFPQGLEFDRSAKLYSALLLGVTTLFVLLAFFNQLNQIVGVTLIVLFALYLVSIGYAIYKGIASPPELSDSDSDSDAETSDDDDANDEEAAIAPNQPTETSPLVTRAPPITRNKPPHSLTYHLTHLLLGFLALSLSGYLLSHSAITLSDALHLSGTVFGLTVVSLATTLPEKLIAVLSGSRGQAGIMAATTAGSNIFLLTLCAGVVAVAGGGGEGEGDGANGQSFVLFELGVAWLASGLFCAVVFLGAGRAAGVLLLAAYVVFLALEFTVFRR